MNVYDTLVGLGKVAGDARAELVRADRVVQEINLRLAGSPATPGGLRAEWRPVYRDWTVFAADSELLGRGDPRLTAEGARRELAVAALIRARALELYRRWKSVVGEAAAASSMGGEAAAPAKKSLLDNGIVRSSLVVAALLCGASAARALLDSRRKAEAPAAPPAPAWPPGLPGAPTIPQFQVPMPAMMPYGSLPFPVAVPVPQWPRYPRPRAPAPLDDGEGE